MTYTVSMPLIKTPQNTSRKYYIKCHRKDGEHGLTITTVLGHHVDGGIHTDNYGGGTNISGSATTVD